MALKILAWDENGKRPKRTTLDPADLVGSGVEGSIIFLGPAGVLTQDNANLFWDNSNNRLGIGLSTPGAALHVNGDVRRGSSSAFIEQSYADAVTLTASTTAVASSLTYAAASFQGMEILYKIADGTDIRTGKIYIANNTTAVSIVDTYTETADVGISWSAAINSGNVELSYTADAGNGNRTMRADIRRLRA